MPDSKNAQPGTPSALAEKPRNRYISIVAEVRDEPYEQTYALMQDIFERYGIGYRQFATNKLYVAETPEGVDELARQFMQRSEIYILQVCRDTGLSHDEAEARMRVVKEKWPAISYREFARKGLGRYSDEEIEQMHQSARGSSSSYARTMADQAGWSLTRARTHLARADVLYGIYQSIFMSYRGWELKEAQFATYASFTQSRRLCALYNEREDRRIIDNKALYMKTYGRELTGRRFWTSLDASFEEFEEFAQQVDEAFCKMLVSSQGRGAFIVNLAERDHREVYEELMGMGRVIAEERIVQHPDIAAFYPGSVNTIRVLAIMDEDKVDVIGAAMRFGNNGGIIDGVAGGGMVSLVDKETGILVSPGYDKTGAPHECHPATGKRFEGFQVPHWDTVLRLVDTGMRVLPGVNYVGWDVAVTPEGALLIEANSGPDPDLFQIPYAPQHEGVRCWFSPYILKGEERVAAQAAAAGDPAAYGDPADFGWAPAEGGGLELVRYHGWAAVVHVPASVDGAPVVAIGERAFQNKREMVSVSIPGSVTCIGHHAFSKCTSLLRVQLEEGPREIGAYAFSCCYNLPEVELPRSLRALSKYAFNCCTSLRRMVLPPRVRSLPEGLFKNCSHLEAVEVASAVALVDKTAFEGCTALSDLRLPKLSNFKAASAKKRG